jgi:hypothetical protein
MKIIGFTMITNPEYRQDPWRESIRQALEVFDEVVVVCGDVNDNYLLSTEFDKEELKRISMPYLHWPQPQWSYEELTRHLNLGLKYCRRLDGDWAVKFDIDTFFHEKDKAQIYQKLQSLKNRKIKLGTFEKYQFFLVSKGYEKGKLPVAVNLSFNTCYGLDMQRYTDLCQPIEPIDGTAKYNDATYEIPKGNEIKSRESTGCHIWNYDYSFKTLARSKELLYNFDISHAKWWGKGYSGKQIKDITPETALNDYLMLVRGRVKKCIKEFNWNEHPKHIQQRIKNIKPEEFGYNLWEIKQS